MATGTDTGIGLGAADPYNPHTGSSAGGTTTTGATSATSSSSTPQSLFDLYTVDAETQTAKQNIVDAKKSLDQVNQQIIDAQQAVRDASAPGVDLNQPGNATRLTNATNTLNELYGKQSTAITAYTAANNNYTTAMQKALDQHTVDPANIAVAQASVNKSKNDIEVSNAQLAILQQAAGPNRDVAVATAIETRARANADQANADLTAATQRGDTAAAHQAQAEANQAQAQADQIHALLPDLQAKAHEEVLTQQATTDLTKANATLATANANQANADANLRGANADMIRAQIAAGAPQAGVDLTKAQTGLAGGQTNQANAAALGTLSQVQQAQLGPLYGLAEKQQAMKQAIGGIAQQVFGPGGSGNVDEANKLLQQVSDAFDASMAGTTPYAASVAAAQTQQSQFGTQASLANAAQQALATRASALGQLGGAALGQLAQMNVNAPKGSTALAGAFQDVVNYMAAKMNTGALAPPQQPQAPGVPPLIARLAGLGGAGTGATPAGMNQQQWGQYVPNVPGGGVPAAGPANNPAAGRVAGGNYNPQQLPMPAVPGPNQPTGPIINGQGPGSAPAPAPSSSGAPVTININSSPGQSGISGSGLPARGPWPMADWPGQGGSPMPQVIAQHAPATPADVHNIWGNELSSGAVRPVQTNPQAVAAQGGVQPLTQGSQPPTNNWPGMSTGSQPPVNTWPGVVSAGDQGANPGVGSISSALAPTIPAVLGGVPNTPFSGPPMGPNPYT